MTKIREDEDAIHLGAWYDGELVSSISAYILDANSALLREEVCNGELSLRYGMRMESSSFRGSHLNSLLCNWLCKSIFECLRPVRTYVVLYPQHYSLQKFYEKRWNHREYKKHEEQVVLMCDDEKDRLQQYLESRKSLARLKQKYFSSVELPDLSGFLFQEGREDLIAYQSLMRENLYTEGLDVELDLPRLCAQAQQLYATQKVFIHKIQKIGKIQRWLDVGSGAGAYLNLLSRDRELENIEFSGVESASLLHQIAQKKFPDIKWYTGSAYQTDFEHASFDLVHCSFLMIHLLCPSLALAEFNRLLRTGGVLYVVDVYDSSFRGPEAMSKVVQRHCEIYEGDRNIMNHLPELGRQHGFKPYLEYNVIVSSEQVEVSEDDLNLVLDKDLLLDMFDFIAQRESLVEEYASAKKSCKTSSEPVSVSIQTQLFIKV
ncbi:class I SAM-dependent methyltransferase [Aliikangiella sp. G2MR2-5]|uniref:class I SAM-dependent methyltransferase n=1 Tax=Aliikangiella sp. G2MR2-5 TaxID=2788943 RepID=UPI001AEE90EF|nr:class I SAM-dependent methyltransferase [Aliikangiella sp. G2MR2-5]